MTKQTSDDALKEATGKVWEEWFTILDRAGAKDMPHPKITKYLYDNKLIDKGWWCQQVTVGYEQHIGRREVGQGNDGAYEVSASKTLADCSDLDVGLERWQTLVANKKTFNKTAAVSEPTVKATEKWRYWRVTFTDKSRVTVYITQKPDGKILVTASQEKINSQTARDAWRDFWKKLLKDL